MPVRILRMKLPYMIDGLYIMVTMFLMCKLNQLCDKFVDLHLRDTLDHQKLSKNTDVWSSQYTDAHQLFDKCFEMGTQKYTRLW